MRYVYPAIPWGSPATSAAPNAFVLFRLISLGYVIPNVALNFVGPFYAPIACVNVDLDIWISVIEGPGGIPWLLLVNRALYDLLGNSVSGSEPARSSPNGRDFWTRAAVALADLARAWTRPWTKTVRVAAVHGILTDVVVGIARPHI